MADAFSPKKTDRSVAGAKSREISRIARAARAIQAEAARALAQDGPPRIRRQKNRSEPALPSLAAGLNDEEKRLLAEVSDKDDRLLMCMPPEIAIRQGLALRLTAVALCTRHNSVFLHKRRQGKTDRLGLWDMYAGHVRPGEARQDAAARVLADEGGLVGLPMTPVAQARPGKNMRAYITLYRAVLSPGLMPAHAHADMLEVDADELAGLLRDSPELLTPELIWAAGTGALFNA